MLKAYKYRLYPTDDQKYKIDCSIGVCRMVYNLSLGIKINAYKEQGISVSAFDLINQLPELRKEYKWIKDINAQALQASIRNVDAAFKNFYNGAGYPKFKSKRSSGSFQCPQNQKVDWINCTLTIRKIKNIPIRIDRRFEGLIKTVTISRTPTGKYYASILVDNEISLPSKLPIESSKTIGIDLGIKDFAITSLGHKIDNPKHLRQLIGRIKILQRRNRRKIKGSKNLKKANLKIAVLYEKVTNQRKDFLQKLSTELVRDNQTTTFCVESLAVVNMIKNHKLSQAIGDVSWAEFIRILKYKCEWSGKNLIEIGRFEASTKTCSNCKEKIEALSLNQREWICLNCLVTHDRDINAAINIKFMGLTHSGQGMPVVPVEKRTKVRSVKQEYLQV